MKRILYNEQDKADFIFFLKSKQVTSAYRVEFSRVRRKRSLEANAYLWLLLTIEEDYTGTDKSDLYDYYLYKFPTFKNIEIAGKENLVPISSSKFDSKQMATFIDNVRREMAINGIATPNPDSARTLEAYEYYRERGIL